MSITFPDSPPAFTVVICVMRRFRRRKLRDIIYFCSRLPAHSITHLTPVKAKPPKDAAVAAFSCLNRSGSGNLGISQVSPIQPLLEVNVQLGADLMPVVPVAGPFLRDIQCRKVQELQETVIRRKYSAALGDLPQLAVESLYGIGRAMPISA